MKQILSIEIQKATPSQAQVLTQVALLSKSYWPYPKDYLDKCKGVLLITENDIQDWPVFTASIENQIVGFFALKTIQNENRLDHLWVLPEFIGKKIGSRLFHRAILEASKIDWHTLRLAADPYAEGFYTKLGLQKIGVVQSRIKSDLFLPHMEYLIGHKSLHREP